MAQQIPSPAKESVSGAGSASAQGTQSNSSPDPAVSQLLHASEHAFPSRYSAASQPVTGETSTEVHHAHPHGSTDFERIVSASEELSAIGHDAKSMEGEEPGVAGPAAHGSSTAGDRDKVSWGMAAQHMHSPSSAMTGPASEPGKSAAAESAVSGFIHASEHAFPSRYSAASEPVTGETSSEVHHAHPHGSTDFERVVSATAELSLAGHDAKSMEGEEPGPGATGSTGKGSMAASSQTVQGNEPSSGTQAESQSGSSTSGAPSQTSKPTPGQALDKSEAQLKEAASTARDIVPESVQRAATQLSSSEGRSQLASQVSQLPRQAAESISSFEIPDEELNKLATRFNELVIQRFGSREDFKRGLEDLMGVASDAYGRARNLQMEMTDSAKEWTVEARLDVQKALQGELRVAERSPFTRRRANKQLTAAKELVENSANGRPIDDLVAQTRGALDELGGWHDWFAMASVVGDPSHFPASTDALFTFLDDLESLVRESTSTGLTSDELRDRTASLLRRFRAELLPQLSDKLSPVIEGYSTFLCDLQKPDDETARFSADLSRLFADLALDAHGRPTFKPQLIRDLSTLLPKMAGAVQYVPVPRIEVETEDWMAVFDNVVVKVSWKTLARIIFPVFLTCSHPQCTDILPSFVRVRTDTLIDSSRPKDDQVVNVVEIIM